MGLNNASTRQIALVHIEPGGSDDADVLWKMEVQVNLVDVGDYGETVQAIRVEVAGRLNVSVAQVVVEVSAGWSRRRLLAETTSCAGAAGCVVEVMVLAGIPTTETVQSTPAQQPQPQPPSNAAAPSPDPVAVSGRGQSEGSTSSYPVVIIAAVCLCLVVIATVAYICMKCGNNFKASIDRPKKEHQSTKSNSNAEVLYLA